MAFLEQIAKKFLNEYGNRLNRLVFVFPNRRAGLFFNRYLQENKPAKQVIWAPQVYSINDFFMAQSNLEVPDQLELIFQLYNLYHERVQPYPRHFDEFYPWGKMILADFNEIDKNLADTEILFRTLHEFKEIEDITKDEKAEIYNRFIGFWDSLGQLYFQFKEMLRKQNKAYEGVIYRDVAEYILRENALPVMRWEKVVFCGFNALSKTEETVFSYLLKSKQGEAYWDMDRYFTADENQESGRFFRENIKSLELKDPMWVDNRLAEHKKIDIIGVQSKVSQAKVLGLKLQNLLKVAPQPEHIAVVMPDESMLFPVLNSLPQEVEKINITLGYPLHQTPVYSLLNAVIEMQLLVMEKDAKGKLSRRVEGFYYKDVQRVLSHPYVKPIQPEEIAGFLTNIKNQNRVYITEKDIRTLSSPLKAFFRLRGDSRQLIDFFLDQIIFIRTFYEENKPELFDIDYEYMYHFYTLLTRIKELLEESGLVLDIFIFRQLFTDIVKNSRIPFTGEPLEGVQLMGMLETQSLDFDHLFLLSLNEDFLPPGKSQQSFIPYAIRRELNLPTYEDRDAIAAYHFYRLLKGAKNITLIYTTEARRIEKSEKSRFIDQLLIEFADRNPNAEINHHIINFPPGKQPEQEIVVEKNQEILQKLERKSYSASSLLTYLTCQLKFYFNYILELYEEDEIAESPDYRLIGSIMHKALEYLYEPFRGQRTPVTQGDLQNLSTRIEPVLSDAYQEAMKGLDITTGRNKIVFEVMRKFLERFIDKEKLKPNFYVLELEEKFRNVPFRFNRGGEDLQVKLEGTVDRLDRDSEGNIQIIDYKTGDIKSLKLIPKDDLTLIDLLTGDEAVKNKAAFQLFFYWYLLKRTRKYGQEKFSLGIYSFKRMDDGLKLVELKEGQVIDETRYNEFETVLAHVFSEILDLNENFKQTEDVTNCQVCPYKNICSRDVQESYIS